jgi:hypothetical protein
MAWRFRLPWEPSGNASPTWSNSPTWIVRMLACTGSSTGAHGYGPQQRHQNRPREAVAGPDLQRRMRIHQIAADVAPGRFELTTRCLEGIIGVSLEVARCRSAGHLAGRIMRKCRSLSPAACLRRLPDWLPEARDFVNVRIAEHSANEWEAVARWPRA